MKRVKKLGIWMDHFIAYIMEFSNNPFKIKTIESQFSIEEKELQKSKKATILIHKEKQVLYDYL